MTIDIAAPPMQAGDVVLVRTHDLPGALIRFGESWKYGKAYNNRAKPAYWNHVALACGADTVLEARARGVAQWAVSDENWADARVLIPPYQNEGGLRALAAMRELQGGGYGWLQLASETLILATGTKLRFGTEGRSICSGAVAFALSRAGLDLGQDPEWSTPADIAALGALWQIRR